MQANQGGRKLWDSEDTTEEPKIMWALRFHSFQWVDDAGGQKCTQGTGVHPL